MMPWTYQGQPVTSALEQYQGFVYLIHNTQLNRMYVGKKNFWKTVKMPPLKGQRRKRTVRKETDWQSYWGSNANLQSDVAALGTDCFDRTILCMCENKTEMSYEEARIQFQLNVLRDPQYYNEFIGCRISARNLR